MKKYDNEEFKLHNLTDYQRKAKHEMNLSHLTEDELHDYDDDTITFEKIRRR